MQNSLEHAKHKFDAANTTRYIINIAWNERSEFISARRLHGKMLFRSATYLEMFIVQIFHRISLWKN